MELSTAISKRPATQKDAAVVAALVAADETVLFGRPSRVGEIDVLDWWNRTDLASDSWLLEEGGRLVGVGWSEARGELGMFVGIVAQGAKGRGLGGALADLGERRVREAGGARAQTWTLGPDSAARELFEGRGYREVRRFYGMAIELEGPPPVPGLPEGLAIDVFRRADARAFHAAIGEAFEDHWEHHPDPLRRSGGRRSSARPASTRPCGSSCATGTRSPPPYATTPSGKAEATSARSACAGAGAAGGSDAPCSCTRSASSTGAASAG